MDCHVESQNHTFSHSSRLNMVKHMFSVGELAFIKMKNELCLVFIHYLSQKLVFCACTGTEVKVVPVGLSAIDSESIYHDYKSHQLHCNMNRGTLINLNNVHGYYIPMYFISFPGYRKKCSKFFRFWVKECDLIPYHSVRNRLANKLIHKLEDISQTLKESLSGCEVDNIDNYVYNMKHRTVDVSKQLLSGVNCITTLPWVISDWMKQFMNEEWERIVNIDWGMDIFCNFVWQSPQLDQYERVFKQLKLVKQYTNVPFYRKFNARSVANEFKFYILLLAKILLRTSKKQVRLWNKQIKISYQCFLTFYVNQLYWIDLLLDWFDVHFIDNCCYCKEERLFLIALLDRYQQVQFHKSNANEGNGKSDYMSNLLQASMNSNFEDWKMKPSDLLGASHLARLLCYPVYYNNYLSKLCVNGVNIEGICLPIYQLFLYFLSYYLRDYTIAQDYNLE